jgi:uncharacterized protein
MLTVARSGLTSVSSGSAARSRPGAQRDHEALRKHCTGLEQLIRTYAQVINELSLENQALREQHVTVTPPSLHSRHLAGATHDQRSPV